MTFKDSEHKAAAEKFTQYLTTPPETQAAWYGATKSLPAAKAAYDRPEIKDSAEADSLKVFRGALDTGKEIPALEKWNEIAAAIEAPWRRSHRAVTLHRGQEAPGDHGGLISQ